MSLLDESSYHRVITMGINIVCQYYNGSTLVKANWADYGRVFQLNENFAPMVDNSFDLGAYNFKWKNLYLAGYISNGNSTYGLTLPDTTNFTANKEIATTDQAFNVINASDITNNTLTQAQYDLITNGKPTLIMGTLFNRNNSILFSGGVDGVNYYGYIISFAYGNIDLASYLINTSTKIISFVNNVNSRIHLFGNSLNGKQLPAYPASTGTFVLKCIDGTLTWVAE